MNRAITFAFAILLSIQVALAYQYQVADTLAEGQTQNYMLGPYSVETTAVYISDPGVSPPEVKFSLNGVLTRTLRGYESDNIETTTGFCVDIGVNQVLAAPGTSAVSFTIHDELCDEEIIADSLADTLAEGETRTYIIDGKEYEITLAYVTDPDIPIPGAKFSVNGELTSELRVGDVDTLQCINLRATEVVGSSRQGLARFAANPTTCVSDSRPFVDDQQMDTWKLSEGQTKTFDVNGLDYEVALLHVSECEEPGYPAVQPVHPADTNADFRVTINEVTAYGNGVDAPSAESIWKNGEKYGSAAGTWVPIHPADANADLRIDINEVTGYGSNTHSASAGEIWRSGERYTWKVNTWIALSGTTTGQVVCGETEARFSVNGERTHPVAAGDSYTLADGAVLKVYEIVQPAGQTGWATFHIVGGSGTERVGFPQPYFIVVGTRAPTQDVLDAIDFQKKMQENLGDASGRAIFDEDAIEIVKADSLRDNIAVVMGSKHALVLSGNQLSREQVPLTRTTVDTLKGMGFEVVSIGSTTGMERYLLVSNMLDYFEEREDEEGDRACVQVVTPAYNPGNGRCAEFNTPCDVPAGWIKVNDCPSNEEIPLPYPVPPAPETCTSGCMQDNRCLPIGTRVANGEAKYCGVEGEFVTQQQDGTVCQNNYECVSNQCLNAVCTSLEKEMQKSNSLLQKILERISGWFS